jgi:4-amino-4-deoxy-L-arabinose transferase-like glycosyltransferase
MRRLFRLPDAAWLVLGLLIRLTFAFKLGDALYQADEWGFDAPAWGLAQTGLFGVDGRAIIQPPVPSSFFAFFYFIFGHHPLAARIGQAFVGAALPWIIARAARDLTGSEKAGKLSLMLAAIYPFFIYYGGMLISETLYLPLAIAGLWLLCRALREKAPPLWEPLLCGLCFGLASLCRTEGVGLFPIIMLIVLLVARRNRLPTVIAFLVFLVPLGLWSIRNHAHNGHWTLDEHGGTTLLHGSVVFDEDQISTSVAMDALHEMKFWQDGWKMDEDSREKYFTQVALQYMREHPARTLRQWAQKFVNFWRLYPRLDHPYKQIQGDNPAAGFKRPLLVLISLLFEPALIFGGLYGLWKLGPSFERVPLWLFVLGTNAVHVITVGQMRYRLAIMPVLILGLCYLLSTTLFDESVA